MNICKSVFVKKLYHFINVHLILDQPKNVAKNIIAEDNTLGIRIVKEPFCFKLMERMKRPLVSTSANISGNATPMNFKEISQEIIYNLTGGSRPFQVKCCL